MTGPLKVLLPEQPLRWLLLYPGRSSVHLSLQVTGQWDSLTRRDTTSSLLAKAQP